MHKRLFKVDAKKIGGDTGYAGTANRNLCKEMGIQTSFVRRGRPATEKNDKDYVIQELARVRATAMEGSFGTQKEHYAMRRIKARKKQTEILYIPDVVFAVGYRVKSIVDTRFRQWVTERLAKYIINHGMGQIPVT